MKITSNNPTPVDPPSSTGSEALGQPDAAGGDKPPSQFSKLLGQKNPGETEADSATAGLEAPTEGEPGKMADELGPLSTKSAMPLKGGVPGGKLPAKPKKAGDLSAKGARAGRMEVDIISKERYEFLSGGSKRRLEGERFPKIHDPALNPNVPVQPQQPAPVPAAQVDAPKAASEARQIQNLAQEIVQEIRVTGDQDRVSEIEIQFNSRTLEGLHVRVSRQEAQISIQFSTQSAQVSRLLSGNLGQLSQNLMSHGMPPPTFKIHTGPTEPVNARRVYGTGRDNSPGGGGGGRNQRGGR